MSQFVNALFVLGMFVFLAGCAPSMAETQRAVATALGQQDFLLTEIPSGTPISDGIVIALGGGNLPNKLRLSLLVLQGSGTSKHIAITSSNSLLAKIILSNTLKELPNRALSTLHIAFAGDQEDGEALRETAPYRSGVYRRPVGTLLLCC